MSSSPTNNEDNDSDSIVDSETSPSARYPTYITRDQSFPHPNADSRSDVPFQQTRTDNSDQFIHERAPGSSQRKEIKNFFSLDSIEDDLSSQQSRYSDGVLARPIVRYHRPIRKRRRRPHINKQRGKSVGPSAYAFHGLNNQFQRQEVARYPPQIINPFEPLPLTREIIASYPHREVNSNEFLRHINEKRRNKPPSSFSSVSSGNPFSHFVMNHNKPGRIQEETPYLSRPKPMPHEINPFHEHQPAFEYSYPTDQGGQQISHENEKFRENEPNHQISYERHNSQQEFERPTEASSFDDRPHIPPVYVRQQDQSFHQIPSAYADQYRTPPESIEYNHNYKDDHKNTYHNSKYNFNPVSNEHNINSKQKKGNSDAGFQVFHAPLPNANRNPNFNPTDISHPSIELNSKHRIHQNENPSYQRDEYHFTTPITQFHEELDHPLPNYDDNLSSEKYSYRDVTTQIYERYENNKGHPTISYEGQSFEQTPEHDVTSQQHDSYPRPSYEQQLDEKEIFNQPLRKPVKQSSDDTSDREAHSRKPFRSRNPAKEERNRRPSKPNRPFRIQLPKRNRTPLQSYKNRETKSQISKEKNSAENITEKPRRPTRPKIHRPNRLKRPKTTTELFTTNPRTTTPSSKPFTMPPFKKTSLTRVGGTRTKLSSGRPIHIPGTARHPELSKIRKVPSRPKFPSRERVKQDARLNSRYLNNYFYFLSVK